MPANEATPGIMKPSCRSGLYHPDLHVQQPVRRLLAAFSVRGLWLWTAMPWLLYISLYLSAARAFQVTGQLDNTSSPDDLLFHCLFDYTEAVFKLFFLSPIGWLLFFIFSYRMLSPALRWYNVLIFLAGWALLPILYHYDPGYVIDWWLY